MFKKVGDKIKVLSNQKSLFGLFRLINIFFVFFGLSYTMTLLSYDGRSPVNVFNLFFFLIFLQIILLIVGIFYLDDISSHPLFKFFESLLKKVLKTLGVLPQLLTPYLIKKEFLLNSILFNVGVMGALIIKVSFFDVVFGWSTSLSISPEHVKVVSDIISTPWNWFLTQARPSIELIEKTQFFRINSKFYLDEIKSLGDMRELGQWWSFFLCASIFYGFLPRVAAYFFLQKKKSEIEGEELFNYDLSDVSELFELDEKEQSVFHSVLKFLLDEDVASSKDKDKKLKQDWVTRWEKKVFTDFNAWSFEDLTHLLKENLKEKNLKVLILFCEILTFEAYLSEEGKSLAKIDRNKSKDFLIKLLTLNGFDGHEISSFQMRLEEHLKLESKQGKWGKILGIAVASATAFAFGGVLGAGVFVKALGVAGLAGKVTGAVLLSGGLLMATGFEEEGEKIFVGCGNIFAGLKQVAEKPIFREYFLSDVSLFRDLKKLESFIDLDFFSKENMKILKPSLLKYLEELEVRVKLNSEKSSDKLLETIKQIEEKISL